MKGGFFLVFGFMFALAINADITKEKAPIADIALIIDQSGSIGATHYEEEIEFAKHFAASFPVSPNRTRIALVEFSLPAMTKVRLNWDMGVSMDAVQRTLDEMRQEPLGTGTDFAKALQVVMDELQKPESGDRPDAPNVAVLVTDGYLNSRYERQPAMEAARKLRNTGTVLYAIHVKLDPKINKAPIEDLVEMTGNHSRVFAVDDFKRLTDYLLRQITQQIADEYQDCVYEYEPVGLCYRNSRDSMCVQDAVLKIIRPNQPPYGSPCPAQNDVKLVECEPGSCQEACEKWPWGPWEKCVIENCGVNGTKIRQRQGAPPHPKLSSTCLLSESRPCTKEELESSPCPDPGQAEKITSESGSHLPVWAIILIALVCVLILAMIITAVIMYRSPKWRMVFVPTKPRKNQLPGINDTDSKNML